MERQNNKEIHHEDMIDDSKSEEPDEEWKEDEENETPPSKPRAAHGKRITISASIAGPVLERLIAKHGNLTEQPTTKVLPYAVANTVTSQPTAVATGIGKNKVMTFEIPDSDDEIETVPTGTKTSGLEDEEIQETTRNDGTQETIQSEITEEKLFEEIEKTMAHNRTPCKYWTEDYLKVRENLTSWIDDQMKAFKEQSKKLKTIVEIDRQFWLENCLDARSRMAKELVDKAGKNMAARWLNKEKEAVRKLRERNVNLKMEKEIIEGKNAKLVAENERFRKDFICLGKTEEEEHNVVLRAEVAALKDESERLKANHQDEMNAKESEIARLRSTIDSLREREVRVGNVHQQEIRQLNKKLREKCLEVVRVYHESNKQDRVLEILRRKLEGARENMANLLPILNENVGYIKIAALFQEAEEKNDKMKTLSNKYIRMLQSQLSHDVFESLIEVYKDKWSGSNFPENVDRYIENETKAVSIIRESVELIMEAATIDENLFINIRKTDLKEDAEDETDDNPVEDNDRPNFDTTIRTDDPDTTTDSTIQPTPTTTVDKITTTSSTTIQSENDSQPILSTAESPDPNQRASPSSSTSSSDTESQKEARREEAREKHRKRQESHRKSQENPMITEDMIEKFRMRREREANFNEYEHDPEKLIPIESFESRYDRKFSRTVRQSKNEVVRWLTMISEALYEISKVAIETKVTGKHQRLLKESIVQSFHEWSVEWTESEREHEKSQMGEKFDHKYRRFSETLLNLTILMRGFNLALYGLYDPVLYRQCSTETKEALRGVCLPANKKYQGLDKTTVPHWIRTVKNNISYHGTNVIPTPWVISERIPFPFNIGIRASEPLTIPDMLVLMKTDESKLVGGRTEEKSEEPSSEGQTGEAATKEPPSKKAKTKKYNASF
jgi:hypothetical protein